MTELESLRAERNCEIAAQDVGEPEQTMRDAATLLEGTFSERVIGARRALGLGVAELTRLRAALAETELARGQQECRADHFKRLTQEANARAEAMAAERDSLVRAFEAERTALCNSLNSALADTSRLTWLDRDDISLSLGTDPNGPYVVILNAKGIAIAATSDIRSAIDAARSKP